MCVAAGVGSEANFFCTVLSCGEVDLCELRGTSFAFPCCGCSPLDEVGVVALGGSFFLRGFGAMRHFFLAEVEGVRFE